MSQIIYSYDAPIPLNTENLDIEIAASPVPDYVGVRVVDGKVQITLENELVQADKDELDLIIQNHDGSQARTTQQLQAKREAILSRVVNMAHVHPVLKLDPDSITSYLTSIDNYFNSWKRDGNHNVLIQKITDDAAVGEPFEAFLNTEINTEGVKTFQFLVSEIPTTPYI